MLDLRQALSELGNFVFGSFRGSGKAGRLAASEQWHAPESHGACGGDKCRLAELE